MNFLNILNEIEKADSEIYDRINPRRAAMKDFFSFGKKVAAASVPLAIGTMFKKAYGQTASPAVINALNIALAIEHFSAAFYTKGFNEAPFGSVSTAAADKAAIGIIRDHELAHVKFLQDTISEAGGKPVPAPKVESYDFTGKGEFARPFQNLDSFLKIAQGLEDVALRATKGVAEDLMGSPYLTAALNMHAVEARHSTKIRLIRLSRNLSQSLQPWISLNDETDARPGAGAYSGEENVTQQGQTITGINGNSSVDAARATEAFDEPISKAGLKEVLAQFKVFI
ncbi:ferritin-like domain-containing protein [Pedobacter sp. SAFR-022]|uniref:ferritin-like domain-containing protein n=1 Tax=Pedobacter sp. SAFR-022 TaxID=3436861 RepID=UPI003F80FC0B